MDLAGSNGYLIPALAAHMFVFYFGILADDTPPVGMIVNQENSFKVASARQIAAELSVFDLKVTVEALPWAEYTAALADGKYDLYYGEVKLSADWNLAPLLATGGALNYGRYSDATLDLLLQEYAAASDRTSAMKFLRLRPASEFFVALVRNGLADLLLLSGVVEYRQVISGLQNGFTVGNQIPVSAAKADDQGAGRPGNLVDPPSCGAAAQLHGNLHQIFLLARSRLLCLVFQGALQQHLVNGFDLQKVGNQQGRKGAGCHRQQVNQGTGHLCRQQDRGDGGLDRRGHAQGGCSGPGRLPEEVRAGTQVIHSPASPFPSAERGRVRQPVSPSADGKPSRLLFPALPERPSPNGLPRIFPMSQRFSAPLGCAAGKMILSINKREGLTELCLCEFW